MIAGRKIRHAAAVESTFAEPSQCKLNGLKGKSEVNIVKKKKEGCINKQKKTERGASAKKKREKNGEKRTRYVRRGNKEPRWNEVEAQDSIV